MSASLSKQWPEKDYTPYLKHAREQAARRRREAAARRERAWVVAPQMARPVGAIIQP